MARVESAKPVKAKLEALKYGEDLIEGLDLAEEFKYKVEQYAMQLSDYEVIFIAGLINNRRKRKVLKSQ